MCREVTERSLTSMTSRLVFAFALLSSTTPILSAGQESRATVTLEQRVARLGSAGNANVQDVRELAASPAASAKLLVAGLHSIPDSEKAAKAGSPSMEQVLWRIRALRYLTGGLDFCAQSDHVFGASEEEKNRQYWLKLRHKDCLAFFGYWMSRDRIYVAPLDAQKSIIGQWKQWYASSGKTFKYKPLQDPPPEAWIW